VFKNVRLAKEDFDDSRLSLAEVDDPNTFVNDSSSIHGFSSDSSKKQTEVVLGMNAQRVNKDVLDYLNMLKQQGVITPEACEEYVTFLMSYEY
jgi:hypothetical protein